MNDTEKGAKKEQHDPSEKWLDIKEESVEYSALADNACEYKFSPLLLLPPKQESDDGNIPHNLSETSVCKGTNFKVYLDGQIQREDVEYDASCETTRLHQLTSLLPPIEQVFIEDLPNSEGQRTSCKKLRTGISLEESSELETDDYLNDNPLEIKEKLSSYNAHSDGAYDVQSPYLWPLPEGKGNPVEHKLTETKEKPFTCDICNKTYAHKRSLIVHKRIHAKEKPFTCDVCNKSFAHKSSLVVHMHIHAKEKPFTCDICNKVSSQMSTHVKHMLIHLKEKPFTCNVCNKSFRYKSTYVEHMRLHSEGNPHTCDVCNKGFTRSATLMEHMQIHTGEKPFTCDVCNKSFAYKRTLVNHMRIHTKEKPFTCDVCNKAFTFKETLVVHMRIHTKEKPYTCDPCNKAYSHKSSILKHMRICSFRANDRGSGGEGFR